MLKNVNNQGGNIVASTVGGVTGDIKIAVMRYDYYKSLLNQINVRNPQYMDNVLKSLNKMLPKCEVVQFNVMEVIDAIQAIKVQA